MEDNSHILDLLECCLDSMSMQWDGTVKITITSHEVVHIRVLFLEVLQIINRKTQAIGLIKRIPGRSQVTQECGRFLLGW